MRVSAPSRLELQRYHESQSRMRLPDDVFPLSYELDEERHELHISWTDGHESVHPYEPLRRACPCAWCAGEGGQKGSVDKTTEFTEQQTTIYELQPIGRYGLTPIWGDGHHTGIYTYEKLRASCQCDACRAMREDR
jgi:DUF971 family protein